jgi:hypothetical protein
LGSGQGQSRRFEFIISLRRCERRLIEELNQQPSASEAKDKKPDPEGNTRRKALYCVMLRLRHLERRGRQNVHNLQRFPPFATDSRTVLGQALGRRGLLKAHRLDEDVLRSNALRFISRR